MERLLTVKCLRSPIFVLCFTTYFNKTVAFLPFLEHVSTLLLGCHSYCEACKETAGNFTFLMDWKRQRAIKSNLWKSFKNFWQSFFLSPFTSLSAAATLINYSPASPVKIGLNNPYLIKLETCCLLLFSKWQYYTITFFFFFRLIKLNISKLPGLFFFLLFWCTILNLFSNRDSLFSFEQLKTLDAPGLVSRLQSCSSIL